MTTIRRAAQAVGHALSAFRYAHPLWALVSLLTTLALAGVLTVAGSGGFARHAPPPPESYPLEAPLPSSSGSPTTSVAPSFDPVFRTGNPQLDAATCRELAGQLSELFARYPTRAAVPAGRTALLGHLSSSLGQVCSGSDAQVLADATRAWDSSSAPLAANPFAGHSAPSPTR